MATASSVLDKRIIQILQEVYHTISKGLGEAMQSI